MYYAINDMLHQSWLRADDIENIAEILVPDDAAITNLRNCNIHPLRIHE